MTLPLAGRTVLLPRDPERASGLAARLEALGATVLVAPATRTEPAPDPAALEAAVLRLADGAYAWAVLTSVNAVRALEEAAARVAPGGAAALSGPTASGDAAALLAGAPVAWAAVGPTTRRALEALGVTVALVPEHERSAEGLVAVFPDPPAAVPSAPTDVSEPAHGMAGARTDNAAGDAGLSEPAHGMASARTDNPGWVERPARRVLLPQGDLARAILRDGLAARGWEPDVVVAYRTVPVALPADVVRRATAPGPDAATPDGATPDGAADDGAAPAAGVDAVVLTSGSVARQVAAQLGTALPTVCIGRPSAEVAAEVGLDVAAVATAPTDAALADAVVRALAAPATPSEPATARPDTIEEDPL
ncbi:uroporphyrinogen-III synthase [Puerhibacterium puerhi]|uniref:uroporphyrinogen-III synthase n=1 Tax=Puerhibacterium puerhi TaxID=2692623 RepID=UPI00135BB304|nr:uroporphyrinogen-III synthase [Puerhibacterium puerhi]